MRGLYLAGCDVSMPGITGALAGGLCAALSVEPERANDTYLSLRKGERVEVNPDTIADGLRSPMPGKLTFPIIRELAEDVLLVSEEEIRGALKFLLTRMKILVEPSGAVPAAAALYRKLPKGVERVGIVLSGGNVDFEQLAVSKR